MSSDQPGPRPDDAAADQPADEPTVPLDPGAATFPQAGSAGTGAPSYPGTSGHGDPVSPYPPPPGYGPPAADGPVYGQPYGQAPYGQAAYGQPPYGQPPYPTAAPGPNPYQPYRQAPPSHPQAGWALGLGIAGLAGGFTCGLPLLLSPFAWALGHRARREIAESHGRLGGDGMALTGLILGIVGTAILALAVLALLVFAVLVVVGGASTSP